MNEPAPEIVRIGIASAHVTSVSQQRVEYLDEAGQERLIDLEQCARNWVRYHNDHEQDFSLVPGASAESAVTWDSRCVGQRGALDDPPWVEFMNERHTRFEFVSYEAVDALLGLLSKAGWHTFDTD
jgi:hypothetical protein